MRKMLTLASLIAAAAMVSCQKDNLNLSNESSAGDGLKTISLGLPSSRVDVADDGLTVTWKADDKLQLANFTTGTGYNKDNSSTFDLATGAGEKSATFNVAEPGKGIEAGKKYFLLHTGSTSQFTYPSGGSIVITPTPMPIQSSATDYGHIRSNIIYTCTDMIVGDTPDFSSFSPRQSILELRLSLAAASTAKLSNLVVKAPGQWFVASQTINVDGSVSYETTDELRLNFASPVEVGASPASPLVARMLVWWNTDFSTVSGNVQVTLNMDDGTAATVPFAPTQPWTAGAKYKKDLSGITGFAASTSDMPVIVGNEFRIYNRAQFQKIRDFNVYSTYFAGKTIKIMNDIDMGGSTAPAWIPLGSDGRLLAGTVDGGGYKLTNLYLKSTESRYSLFGYVGNAATAAFELKNLNVDGATLIADGEGATYAAVLVSATKYATITNCTIKNADISNINTGNVSTYLGCLVSQSNAGENDVDPYLTITGCTLEKVDLETSGKNSSLVLVVMAQKSKAPVTISNCQLKECSIASKDQSALLFANAANSTALPQITISGCVLRDCVMDYSGSSSCAGGIMANAISGSLSNGLATSDSGLPVTISDCHVLGGTFTATTASSIAGICGVIGSKTVIRNCSNSATVRTTITTSSSAWANLAGICVSANTSALVYGCKNTGAVDGSTGGSNWRVGGIVAINKGMITGCYNTGKIQCAASTGNTGTQATRSGGGVLALNFGAASRVSGSYNNSLVVGGSYSNNIGAVCGLNGYATTAETDAGIVETCFWTAVETQNPSLTISASSKSDGDHACKNSGLAPTVWPGQGTMTKGWTEAPTDWNAAEWGAWTSPWKTFPAPGAVYPTLAWEN